MKTHNKAPTGSNQNLGHIFERIESIQIGFKPQLQGQIANAIWHHAHSQL